MDEPEAELQTRVLRRATYSGEPFGEQAFIEKIRDQREPLLARADGVGSEPDGQRVAYATA